jgi:hypothetical protein
MKFTWGTGILVFIILFLLAAALFITFAMRQSVNLVHDDYYEQGVDHMDQIRVTARSAAYQDSIHTRLGKEFLNISYATHLFPKTDSGGVLLYRPSDSKLDVYVPLDVKAGEMNIPRTTLVTGRYILKLHWYAEGLKYEVEKDIYVE